MEGIDRLAVAMGFIAAAIFDQQAHNALGLSTWRANRLCQEPVEPQPPQRCAREAQLRISRSQTALL